MGRKRKDKTNDKSRETIKRIIENNKYRQGRSGNKWEKNYIILDWWLKMVITCVLIWIFYEIFFFFLNLETH